MVDFVWLVWGLIWLVLCVLGFLGWVGGWVCLVVVGFCCGFELVCVGFVLIFVVWCFGVGSV